MRSLLRSLALRIPAVRALRDQRDDLLRALHDQAGGEASGSGMRWTHHRPYATLGATPGEIGSALEPRPAAVSRLIAAYRASRGGAADDRESHWSHIFGERHREIDRLLVQGDVAAVAAALSGPGENDLFYGFEGLHRDAATAYGSAPEQRQAYADRCQDLLIRLAEAVGLLPAENPESIRWGRNRDVGTDELASRLEAFFGFDIALPPVYAGHFGVATAKGILNDRAINALYVTHRIRQLTSRIRRPSVVEIGGGLGHVARYCHLAGITDYTIIDIPITALSQGYFLMHSIGEAHVLLAGESPQQGDREVKVYGPAHADRQSPRYDLVVNIDSLTELGRNVAAHYVDWICDKAPRFLSINHEANRFTVRELLAGRAGFAGERHPYWMRNGFVEEVFTPPAA